MELVPSFVHILTVSVRSAAKGSWWCSGKILCVITFHPEIVSSNPGRIEGVEGSYYLGFPVLRQVS